MITWRGVPTGRVMRVRTLAAFVSTLLGAACESNTSDSAITPMVKASQTETLQPPSMLRTIDDDFAALAEEVPGFGGMYFDTDGVLTIQLVNPEALAFARPKVVALLERGIRWGPGRTNQRAAVAREMRTVRARFDYRQLVSLYRTEVVPLMGTTEGITMTDIDERQNRIVVGVKDADRKSVV